MNMDVYSCYRSMYTYIYNTLAPARTYIQRETEVKKTLYVYRVNSIEWLVPDVLTQAKSKHD